MICRSFVRTLMVNPIFLSLSLSEYIIMCLFMNCVLAEMCVLYIVLCKVRRSGERQRVTAGGRGRRHGLGVKGKLDGWSCWKRILDVHLEVVQQGL